MKKDKYGFVYIWYDAKKKMYYIGCHWGNIDDGYICSSNWMRKAYRRRPQDFRRRILKTNLSREQMYIEEQRYFDMINPEEIKEKYYNLNLSSKKPWHMLENSNKSVGQKISEAKKGKSTGPCSVETKAKISKSNKGRVFSEEHKEKLRQAKLGKKHTEEWKQKNSERMKVQWADGTRKKAEPKKTMSREQQNKLSSNRLKDLWSDPVWAENQRKRLSEGAKNRPTRTEESRKKTSESVKKAKNINNLKDRVNRPN